MNGGLSSRFWIDSFAACTAAMISSNSVAAAIEGQLELAARENPSPSATPLTMTRSESRWVVRNPVPNLPVVVGRPVLSFVRSFEETCSIRKRMFSAVNAPPLCWKVTCASGSSRSASMCTRTLPPIFTSLAFWINSQTQRLDVVGDASTPARSFVSSSWIFVAIIRLWAFSEEAENCDLNVTDDRPLDRVYRT